jgi:hypothetical protein
MERQKLLKAVDGAEEGESIGESRIESPFSVISRSTDF